jgi:hypothetical protein
MPTLELSTTAVSFLLAEPGQVQVPQTVSVTQSTVAQETVPVTLSFVPNESNTDAFVVRLYSYSVVVRPHGGAAIGAPNWLANAADPGTAGEVQFGLADTFYALQVDLTAPVDPVPGAFVSVVEVSWPGGSQLVTLSAGTAELTATVVDRQPVVLTPGGSATVSVQLNWQSAQADVANVTVSQASYPPPASPGVHVAARTVAMPAVFQEVGGGPKQPLGGGAGKTAPHSELELQRSARVDVPLSAGVDSEPGDDQLIYLSAQVAGLPQVSEAAVDLRLEIPPLPVKMSSSANGQYILRGTSIQPELTIVAPGALTSLNIAPVNAIYVSSIPGGEATSGPADVTVSWADELRNPAGPGWRLEIGEGTATYPFTVDVGGAADGGVVDIPLHWTAYDGGLSGDTIIQVSVLPSALQITGQDRYAKLTVAFQIVMTANGKLTLAGTASVPPSEIWPQEYTFAFGMSATNPQGVALRAAQTGTIGGILGVLTSHTDNFAHAGLWNGPGCWVDTQNAAQALAAWAAICTASISTAERYGPDAAGIVEGLLTGGVPIALVGDGLSKFVQWIGHEANVIAHDFSGTDYTDSDDNAWAEGDETDEEGD